MKIFTDLVFVFIMYSLCSMALAACGPVYVCSLARRGSSSQKYCEAFHRTFPVPLSLPVLHFFYSFTNIIALDSCDYLVFCFSSTVTSNDRELFLKSCAKCPKHLIVYLCFLSNINSIIFQEPEKAVVCEYWFNSGSTVGLESPLTMCIQTDCARRKGRRRGRGGAPNRKTSGQGEPTTGS